jgi:plasmid replication initiation protein
MTDMKTFVVAKANALVQASYKLSLNEQRLVLACVAQLDSRKPLPKDNLFTLTAVDFAETYGIPVDQAYEALNEGSNSLYERDIKVFDGKVKERFRWVYHVKYYEGESKVCLGFSQTIMPYLTMLNKQFTSYQMASIAKLRSTHSIRLYEFLIQYKSTGKLIISLDDLKQRLELDGQYARFSNMKMRILDPAVKELKEKSSLVIDWRAIKKGRTVERLEFTFRDESIQTSSQPTPKPEKKAAAIPNEKRINGVTISDIEKYARPGETYESAAMRIAVERRRASQQSG